MNKYNIDSNYLLKLGINVQNEVANISDYLLSDIVLKEKANTESLLKLLLLKLEDIDMDDLNKNKFFSILPFRKNKLDINDLCLEIEEIISKLDKSSMILMKNNIILKKMQGKNNDYFSNVNEYINKANYILDDVSSNDSDYKTEYIDILNKKLYELNSSLIVCSQNTELINNLLFKNNAMIQSIEKSIINTIPLWKNSLINKDFYNFIQYNNKLKKDIKYLN